MIAVTDPFMAGTPTRRPGDFERTVKGVPKVDHPTEMLKDGSRPKRVQYRRPSGFGKQIESTYNLQKWGERQEALGFALDFNLLKRAATLLEGDRDSKAWKDEADKVVVAAKQAAKAWIAADRGTHSHGLAEDDDEGRDVIGRIEHGESLGLASDVQRALVAEWRAMLERNGLEILAVEFACVNDHYKAAGTGDRIARLTKSLRFRLITGEIIELAAGAVVVLDLKTGQRRLDNADVVMYWQSYAVQVAIYAGGCLYDPETDTRTPYPWPVDQEWALIAHLDVLGAMDGRPSCELVLVDLKAGRAAADLCVAARAWENETTVFSVAQLDPAGEQLADSTTEVAPSLGGEIVEGGVGEACTTSPPSTPIAGEVEGAACTPSPAGSHGAGHGLEGVCARQSCSSTLHQPHPDPSRLALVDARGTLSDNPLQGADLSDGEAYGELWDRMQVEFNALPAEARSWRAALVTEAQRRGVPFHVQVTRTERTWHLNRAIIALATAGQCDDEIVRHLLGPIVGDVAYFVGVGVGHVVGSLGATEAERFAALVDAFLAEPGGDAA